MTTADMWRWFFGRPEPKNEVPELLVVLVKRSESFARVATLKPVPTAVPYQCPAGFWTIGYGELCQPDHPPITEPEAALRLEQILLPSYVGHTLRLSPGLAHEPQRRLVAVADFIYNLGPARYAASILRRRIDAGRWTLASDEIQRWVYGGGKKLPGLVKRRAIEAGLLN